LTDRHMATFEMASAEQQPVVETTYLETLDSQYILEHV